MDKILAIIPSAVAIGVGATIVMDLWALLLRRGFGVASLASALLGRWIGHLGRGRFTHESIARAEVVPHERVIGWTAHYTIGVAFAALLPGICGLEWLNRPTLMPA